MSGFANPVAFETQSEALEEREIAQELGMTDDSDVGSFFRGDALGREKTHENLQELLAQLAKYCDVSVKILSVAAVLKGEFARMQAVKNMHTKIESKLKKVSSDAIATVTIMIESVSANRLRTACVVGDADEVRRELAKGVDPNEEVSVSPAAAAALPLCLC